MRTSDEILRDLIGSSEVYHILQQMGVASTAMLRSRLRRPGIMRTLFDFKEIDPSNGEPPLIVHEEF